MLFTRFVCRILLKDKSSISQLFKSFSSFYVYLVNNVSYRTIVDKYWVILIGKTGQTDLLILNCLSTHVRSSIED